MGIASERQKTRISLGPHDIYSRGSSMTIEFAPFDFFHENITSQTSASSRLRRVHLYSGIPVLCFLQWLLRTTPRDLVRKVYQKVAGFRQPGRQQL